MGGVPTDFSRAKLKAELWQVRADYEWRCPLCDVCGKPLGSRGAMHESVVRRGVARGWSKEDRLRIFVPCNCHLVHHGKCHERAHANPDLMVAIQIVRYGYEVVSEWIESLPFKVPFAWSRGLDDDTARTMVEEQAPWILK